MPHPRGLRIKQTLTTCTGIVLFSVLSLPPILSTASDHSDDVKRLALGSPPPLRLEPAEQKVDKGSNNTNAELPLAFESNVGQTKGPVRFILRGRGYDMFLTQRETVMVVGSAALSTSKKKDDRRRLRTNHSSGQRSSVIRMFLDGTNPAVQLEGEGKLLARKNYFIGNDPKSWHVGVSQYSRVRLREQYSGIDLVYRAEGKDLEYDFMVSPGADPQVIAIAFAGAARRRIDNHGDLILGTANGELRHRKPKAYQVIDGERRMIPIKYKLGKKGRVSFEIGHYDKSKSLVIDPVIVYATYLSGSTDESAQGIAVDPVGNTYVVGSTHSANFPTVNALYSTSGGAEDFFISKFDFNGNLIFSTYLGGSGLESFLAGGPHIALDPAGDIYVTGWTDSGNFPTTAGSYQTTKNGPDADAFITKLKSTGDALIYSTYLSGGGQEQSSAIAVDLSGNAYVVGTQFHGFPTTPGAFQTTSLGGSDAFVVKLNSLGSGIIYSTLLGGSNFDQGRSIAVDALGNAYVAGHTVSSDFPTTPSAYQTNPRKMFVTKLNASGSGLMYSTYLGGSPADEVYRVAVDASGNAYVAGNTSSAAFPTTAGAFSTSLRGFVDGFVTKLDENGATLKFSTYLGGSRTEVLEDLAVDGLENVIVVGRSTSTDFPTQNALQTKTPVFAGRRCDNVDADFFCYALTVTRLNNSGSGLLFSTFIGGTNADESATAVGVDCAGMIHIAGYSVRDFPTVNAFQPSPANAASSAIVAEITDFQLSPRQFPEITPGEPFNTVITANGGLPPYVFSVACGNLPPGLALSPAGELSGVVNTSGSFAFMIKATDSSGAVGAQSYAVNLTRTAPAITWNSLPPIQYGTLLSAAQLNATANVAGTFTYNPVEGVALDAGSHQLSVTFTPTDTVHYTTATATNLINVVQAPLTITADDKRKIQCEVNPQLTASYSGFVLGQDSTVLSGTLEFATPGAESSGVGTYPIIPSGLNSINYAISYVNGSLVIDPDVAPPRPDIEMLPDVVGECAVTLVAPTATDNCDGRIMGESSDPLSYSSSGTFVVTWHYRDRAGNESTQTQKAIVNDLISPVINAPTDVTVFTGPTATSCAVHVSDATLGVANATDNCGTVSIIRNGVPAGNLFPVGTTTISYTAIDASGRTASATQIVSVIDNTPPTIAVPSPMTVSSDINCQASIPDLLPQVSSLDNCSNVTLEQSPSAGTLVGLGTHTITITATDAIGNRTTATTTFTVNGIPSFALSVTPSSVRRNRRVTLNAAFNNCSMTNQTVMLRFTYSTPCTQPFVRTIGPLTLQPAQSGNIPVDFNIANCTGIHTFILDVFVGGVQIGTSSAQVVVTP